MFKIYNLRLLTFGFFKNTKYKERFLILHAVIRFSSHLDSPTAAEMFV